MAYDYSRSVATADRLLARFGGAGTLHRAGEPASAAEPWDPIQSGAAPAVPDSSPCVVVRTRYDRRDVNGTSVLATDWRLLVSARAGLAEPRRGDTISFAGDHMKVVASAPISPSGEAILYVVQGR